MCIVTHNSAFITCRDDPDKWWIPIRVLTVIIIMMGVALQQHMHTSKKIKIQIWRVFLDQQKFPITRISQYMFRTFYRIYHH